MLSFDAVNKEFVCKICIIYQYVVDQCALTHMIFGNDQVVRLLEHVR